MSKIKTHTELIAGPCGQLELAIDMAEGVAPSSCFIICHPHPLHGGTLSNKVVTTLSRSFCELGYQGIRFNFRGIGQSEGSYGEGIEEVADLNAVVDWVASQGFTLGGIAGFSFGAYVAHLYALEHMPPQLVLVAPAVRNFPFRPDFSGKDCLMIIGETDELVSPQEVQAYIDGLTMKPRFMVVPGASHFFHGKLLDLKAIILEQINSS